MTWLDSHQSVSNKTKLGLEIGILAHKTQVYAAIQIHILVLKKVISNELPRFHFQMHFYSLFHIILVEFKPLRIDSYFS